MANPRDPANCAAPRAAPSGEPAGIPGRQVRAVRPLPPAAVLAAALAVGAAGCAQPDPAEPDTGPVPAAAAGPADVCQAFAAALYTADTTRDPSRGAAASRHIRPLITSPLDLPAAGPAADVGDAQWTTWTRHQARTAVTVTDASADHPTDHDGLAYRAAAVTVTPEGRDGWRGPTDHHTAFCQLVHHHGRWLVDGYTLR